VRPKRPEGGRHIDVLVNNAGFLSVGAIEEVSLDSARAQMETSFFGSVRMLHAVVPAMRERGSGRIINVTSLAGIVPLPFWGFYNASKGPSRCPRTRPDERGSRDG
jgi:short-subunit dehydrogenase